ncbi:TIGR02391 family protein, partial [Vibrio parahaemolyticus]|uniref:TIGR02391 family protein n=3 Tax=Vibrionaceae TaxID=641 RepID=UPI001E4EB286
RHRYCVAHTLTGRYTFWRFSMLIGAENTFFDVVEQYQKAYDKALEILSVYEDADCAELTQRVIVFKQELDSFLNISGLDSRQCGSLNRHLHFMELYLGRGRKLNAESDIRDIVFTDLPALLKQLTENRNQHTHFDLSLRDSVLPLVHGGHYDSAIRKAFIVMTDRLRRCFGITEQIDGDQLVNMVFGKGGDIALSLDDSQKQAYRNLLSGIYGVYRNKFAHNDVTPTLSEVKAVLEMINNIIIEIETLSLESVAKNV